MFKVPERYRITRGPMVSDPFELYGAFFVPSVEPGRWQLIIVACGVDDPGVPDGHGWEHVSVHAANRRGHPRIPTWREMCQVKSLFWDDDDVVMQLHVPSADLVNTHPHTLHLWRHRERAIPLPPTNLV